jgi:MHS family proline/betaine transporter-like MFS transporter
MIFFLRLLAFGVVGGLTPLVATWLVARTGNEIAPGFLMMVAAAVTFLTILRFPETCRTPFVGSTSRAAAAFA